MYGYRKVRKAREQALEREEELLKTFQREFEQKIASGEPEPGITRIQLLEELTHRLNMSNNASDLKYVSDMINAIDEDEIIELKKENS